MPRDNTNFAAKVELRNIFLADAPTPTKILECYAGEERKLYNACYEGMDVTALDLKGGHGVKKIDNRIFIKRHADDYNFFDMDAYGSPYELLVTLAATRKSHDPFIVIVTDGLKLNLNYQHAPKIIQTTSNLSGKLNVPGLFKFHNYFIWYILKSISQKYDIEITNLRIANGDCGNMKYFGFSARKRNH